MAGRGPAANPDRIRTPDPVRGDIQVATETGWQHGQTPPPPDGLTPAAVDAWSTWMASWFASFWTPSDLPGLRQLVRLYDQVERGEFQRAAELRLQMDTYGITPKGQQDRRWRAPVAPTVGATPKVGKSSGAYKHLRPA